MGQAVGLRFVVVSLNRRSRDKNKSSKAEGWGRFTWREGGGDGGGSRGAGRNGGKEE